MFKINAVFDRIATGKAVGADRRLWVRIGEGCNQQRLLGPPLLKNSSSSTILP